jgi:hypothetical protein
MTSQNPPNNILYKQIISNDLSDELLNYFNIHYNELYSMNGSNLFPQRKQMRDIPIDLCDKLVDEIKITMSNNFNNFDVDTNNIRIYYSDFGIVKPHKDVVIKENYNNTLLIYLSDDFDGGQITVKIPIEEIKKHYYVTPEARKCYGILFPKECIHYTDELYTGGKYIVLLDCQTDFL